MLISDLSLAKIVLDHKYLQNARLLIKGGQMDPVWVLFFTIDLGNPT